MNADISPKSLMDMQLGKVLKHLMVERDVKVSQLSRATKVPIQTLHNWLSGQHPRNMDQLKRLAEHFGVSVDYLLFGSAPREKASMFEQYQDEINAGEFEVILRRIKAK